MSAERRPVHKTLVDALQRVRCPEALRGLARLIVETEIPDNQTEIYEVMMQRAQGLSIAGEEIFTEAIDSLQKQGLAAQEKKEDT